VFYRLLPINLFDTQIKTSMAESQLVLNCYKYYIVFNDYNLHMIYLAEFWKCSYIVVLIRFIRKCYLINVT